MISRLQIGILKKLDMNVLTNNQDNDILGGGGAVPE